MTFPGFLLSRTDQSYLNMFGLQSEEPNLFPSNLSTAKAEATIEAIKVCIRKEAAVVCVRLLLLRLHKFVESSIVVCRSEQT